MCMGSAPKTPAPPPLPPEPPPPPTMADPAVSSARRRTRAQAALAGRAADIITTPLGDLSPVNTTKKTALGQ